VKEKILFLGLSTGGPAHINRIFSKIKKLNCHIIIAQHMKEDVINFFVKDLSSSFSNLDITAIPVTLNHKKKVVVCGKNAYIADVTNRLISINCKDNRGKFTPDIDTLFLSAVDAKISQFYRVYAALMTGIGDDGAVGLLKLKENGATTIAESEDSAPVFGMPRCAIEIGAADYVLSLDEMISFFVQEGLIYV